LNEFIRICAIAAIDADPLFRTNVQATAATLALEPIGYDLAVDKGSSFMFAHADAIQAMGADIVICQRCRSNDIEAGIQKEGSSIIIDILNRNTRRASLRAAAAMKTLEDLIGDIIGGFDFSAQHSIKQYQLAPRTVNFPSGGFKNRAMLVAVTATDAFIEGALPFF